MTNKEATLPSEIIIFDPGIDDALAYLLAQAALKNTAYVSTIGNADAGETTQNMHALVDFEQTYAKTPSKNTQVFMGADRPLYARKPYSADKQFIHGQKVMEGLGNNFPRTAKKTESLYNQILQNTSPQPIDVYSFSPLTEASRLVKRLGERSEIISSVTIMGGTIGEQGSAGIYSEPNFAEDPRALKQILVALEKNSTDTLIVPTNGTQAEDFQVTSDHLIDLVENLEKRGSHAIAKYFSKLIGEDSTYYKFYRSRLEVFKFVGSIPVEYAFPGAPAHDLVALMARLHPDLFHIEEYKVAITDLGQIGIGRSYFKDVVGTFKVVMAPADGAGPKFWEIITDYLSCYYN
jgi:inosine-uridine nucleoside N-ribohydrolase